MLDTSFWTIGFKVGLLGYAMRAFSIVVPSAVEAEIRATDARYPQRLYPDTALFEQVRDKEVAQLGVDHPSTLHTRANLAWAYHAAGKLPGGGGRFGETHVDSALEILATESTEKIVRCSLRAARAAIRAPAS